MVNQHVFEVKPAVKVPQQVGVFTTIVSLEVLKNKDMATSDLKKRLLEYVQEADEPMLRLMESLAQNYNKEAVDESAPTEDQWEIIDERWDAYLRGEGESYTLEEVKERTRRAAK